MKNEYYTDKVLPAYRELYDTVYYKRPAKRRAFLVEDHVQSHGTRGSGDNPARRYKEKYQLVEHNHPSKSPDLNPVEGV